MATSGNPAIPTIDFTPFANPNSDKSSRVETATALREACSKLGFCYIRNHGVPPELLSEAFLWSKRLFDLPKEEKMKAPHPPGPIPHRGYSKPGLEKVYGTRDLLELEKEGKSGEEEMGQLRKVEDFKESYEIGSESNPPQPNIWLPPDVLPGFREFMTKFYWRLEELAKAVLLAFGEGLNLTESEMEKMLTLHSGHNNQLRLLHYPPVPAEWLEKTIVARMPAHTDWSSFTFLFQDDCGGLELENPGSKEFVAATPKEGTLVLNIGDMWMRASNGIFSSATHRVTIPPLEDRIDGKERTTRGRYSIPYFVAPDHDGTVETYSSLVNGERPKKYEPVVFKDYGLWLAKYQYTK